MSDNRGDTPKEKKREPLLERAVQRLYALEDKNPEHPRRTINLSRVHRIISRFTPGN
mgnify:FL=1